MRQVLKRPLLSEKSHTLNNIGKYVFEVMPEANKIEIRKAVEERYKVGVTNVHTITIRPKKKFQLTKRGYLHGKTNQRKKAIVTLRKGQTINLLEETPTNE